MYFSHRHIIDQICVGWPIAAAIATDIVLIPLALVNGFPAEYLVYSFIGTIIILLMHRNNISRLIAGKERKLGEKAEKISRVERNDSI